MVRKIFVVDAFAEDRFKGNPAAVVPLEAWLPDPVLQNIAMENNLSETAFVVPEGDAYQIRWFTPMVEVSLCGHATLASAHVLFSHLGYEKERVVFRSRSGELRVTRKEGMIVLDFPSDPPLPVEPPKLLKEIFGVMPTETLQGRDLIAVYDDEISICGASPDIALIRQLDVFALIITARGRKVDFVSRFFAPREGVPEDPVTGSAHTELVPYWSKKLGKTKLLAQQCSPRGGILHCEDKGDRVLIGGKAITYLEGSISLS